jgi:hypothetical protein
VTPAPPQRNPRLAAGRARGALALARARLGHTATARVGFAAALVTALGFGIVAFVLRASGSTSFGILLTACARSVAWVGGASLALAVAHDRATFDRRDGIDILAAAHGISDTLLESARVVAAMVQIALVVGIPLVLVGLALTPLGSREAALRHLGATGALASFAVVAAVTLGGAAAACGRVGRRRGRLLFAVIVLVPWALADIAGHPSWSIPGALDAVLTTAMSVFLGGASAA